MPRWAKYLLFAVVVVGVLVGAAFAAAAYTGRSPFCDGCHEMDPYSQSWSESTHKDTSCVECHIPKGSVNFAKTKAFAFREIWVHVTTQVTPPLAVTRDIPNDSCTQCHADLPPTELASTTFDHSQHTQRCISCHQRLVHRSVTPPTYADPATMDACFTCHDGSQAAKACATCHTAPHDDMGKACEVCHGLEDWTPSGFKHPFALEYAHAEAKCTSCHPKEPAAGEAGSALGKAPTTCAGCHKDPHGRLNDCKRCHTPKGWKPASFDHPPAGEHRVGSGSGIACRECHPSGYGSVSCTCHGGNAPVGD